MPEIVYERTVPRMITMYPKQWAPVIRLAHERHRGNVSAAMRESVDELMELREKVNDMKRQLAKEANDAAD